jgi:hypothetical protein
MEKLFLIALLITFLFCSVKILEMKYLEKKWKPLKFVIRDALIVFSCSIVSMITFFSMSGSLTDFFNVITENKILNQTTTQIFTDEPGF